MSVYSAVSSECGVSNTNDDDEATTRSFTLRDEVFAFIHCREAKVLFTLAKMFDDQSCRRACTFPIRLGYNILGVAHEQEDVSIDDVACR